MKTIGKQSVVVGLALVVLGAAPASAQRRAARPTVSWWTTARAVPVAAYANDRRLGTDALMLKGVARTMLPMRELFTALGATVQWDARQRAVYAWKPDGTGVRFGVGERRAQVLILSEPPGGSTRPSVSETVTLDAPAMLVSNRVYVPIRAATEALRADVRWVGSEPAVYISAQAGDDVSTGTGSTSTADVRALTVSLATPKDRVRQGAAIPLKLTLANPGETPIALPFLTGQRFDFEVLRNGRLVWSWSHDRAFTQSLSTLTLQPGEQSTFSTTWNQRGNDGRQVAPGLYVLRAYVAADTDRRRLTVSDRFRIVR